MNYKNINDPVLCRYRLLGAYPFDKKNKNKPLLIMKQAIRIPNKDMKKYLTAATFSGVTIDPEFEVIGNNTHAELVFNDIAKVIEMGGYVATLSPEDIKKEDDRKAKLAKAE